MKKLFNQLSIFADGGSRGNPGPAAIGFVIKDETGKALVRQGKKIGLATNNVAEYTSVIEALKEVAKWQNSQVVKIVFFLDSQLVVKQLNGFYKIKNARLRSLIVKVRQLERAVGGEIVYLHVTRDKNQEADKLVNQSFSSG